MCLRRIFVCCLAVCFLTLGCSSKKEKTGGISGQVGVVESATASLTANPLSLNGLNDERFSFTPTSLKINASVVCAAESIEASTSGANTSGREVNVPINKEIELIGQTAFTALAQGSVDDVTEDKFGSYSAVKFLHAGTVKTSGTVMVAGETYTFSDLEVGMTSTGIAVGMPISVTLDANTSPTVNVFFDVSDALFLVNSTVYRFPTAALIPGTDISVVAENLQFIPYVGTDTPTFKKFKIVVADQDYFYLRLSVLLNTAGQTVGGVWNTIFTGTSPPTDSEWGPCQLNSNGITENADGSYALSTYSGGSCPQSRVLTFAAFKFEDHSGTLTHGGTNYSYVATAL